jgi:8-oxo-dGTP pyrophosphatase MutT (NUDIX family)
MAEPEQPEHVIPYERLPPGFARRLEQAGNPATPRPAATVVVLREGAAPLEVLLLRRVRSAGFVPGAYVFPGGRVDRSDRDPQVLGRLSGRDEGSWSRRLGLRAGDGDGPSGAAFVVAALRETFEETGLLIARDEEGSFAPSAGQKPGVARLRSDLMAGKADFAGVLDELGLRLDDGSVEYVAHWITPQAEPRRYDTRFFAVRLPGHVPVAPWEKEITDHRWLSPSAALELHGAGNLPMVFPTIRTLEGLRPFGSPDEVLEHYRGREIRTILPRLVRTPTGVGIRVPDGGA